jgi:hypothetical protein
MEAWSKEAPWIQRASSLGRPSSSHPLFVSFCPAPPPSLTLDSLFYFFILFYFIHNISSLSTIPIGTTKFPSYIVSPLWSNERVKMSLVKLTLHFQELLMILELEQWTQVCLTWCGTILSQFPCKMNHSCPTSSTIYPSRQF